MMKETNESWKKFAMTGNVSDYLTYAATRDREKAGCGRESVKKGVTESERKGTGTGNGVVSHAVWRI